ncbi:MAG TPA: hypothetical protein VJ739_06350 [Gemmataceae bacterium]|nr:hypothetical protein [Gemmataceae bacterium]
MRPPTRIKLYGLFTVTRAGYVAQLVLMAVLLVLLLIAWGRLPPPAKVSPNLPPEYRRIIALLRWIPWAVGGLAALIVLEAFFVFRRFAREEARQRGQQLSQSAAPKPGAPEPSRPEGIQSFPPQPPQP